MNAYVAGRATRLGIEHVQRVREILLRRGLEVYDWTRHESQITKPYRDNASGRNQNAALSMIVGAKSSDVFVLVGDPDLHGALMECGAAMAAGRHVFLVECQRQSIFDCLPNVTWYDSIDEFEKDFHSFGRWGAHDDS